MVDGGGLQKDSNDYIGWIGWRSSLKILHCFCYGCYWWNRYRKENVCIQIKSTANLFKKILRRHLRWVEVETMTCQINKWQRQIKSKLFSAPSHLLSITGMVHFFRTNLRAFNFHSNFRLNETNAWFVFSLLYTLVLFAAFRPIKRWL